MILIVGSVLPATANASTGYFFDGGKRSVSNNGAYLACETQNPAVAANSSVSVWPMVTDGVGNYAQVGWLKYASWDHPYYFYEYNYQPTNFWQQISYPTLGSPAIGSTNGFKVGNDSTYMYFVINNGTYGTVRLSSIPFSRNQIQFFGETHNTEDQCPGSASNKLSMSSAMYKNTSNTWVSTTAINPYTYGYGYLDTMRNDILLYGSSSWNIWDDRY